jgi:GNAT superfamily N-acetyltransferase
MTVDIREADLPGDLAALEGLWLEYLTWVCEEVEARYGFSESAQDLVAHDIATIERFGPPDGRLLLAFVDDVAVGTVCMQRIGPDMAELKRMYVEPSHRHGGLGRALVDRLIAMVRMSGYERIWLDSPDFMSAAHRLYRASGFIDIGPYPGTGIPESLWPRWLFMERTLDPEAPT